LNERREHDVDQYLGVSGGDTSLIPSKRGEPVLAGNGVGVGRAGVSCISAVVLACLEREAEGARSEPTWTRGLHGGTLYEVLVGERRGEARWSVLTVS